jgi:6,7-dimethyl-8-ribityllumazine synthase
VAHAGDAYAVVDAATLDAVQRDVGRMWRGSTDGRGLRVGLACGLFNGGITGRLVQGAVVGLRRCRVDSADVTVVWAPGSFELPLVARSLAESEWADAVVCLGAVIRGETGHYDFVAGECARGLQRVQLDTGVPVVFGVLTTETVDQALARSELGQAGEDEEGWTTNKGWEAALTAVEMATLLRGVLARPPFRSPAASSPGVTTRSAAVRAEG